jgi:ubiquinone/menaquinone biosynthesis C-methylase UbiE
MEDNQDEQLKIKRFYNDVYHVNLLETSPVPLHLRRLAKTIQVTSGEKVLDVACGTGQWLKATATLGALPSGIDISQKAIDACKKKLPEGNFFCGPAESLPFSDAQFDVVTCFGALEHFIDPYKALLEMVRVAQHDAKILLLVPNTDFLTARLGFYKGTYQADIKEEAKTIEEWNLLFEKAGLQVVKKWRDLHILNLSWILRGTWLTIPFRLVQALVLPFWPLRWQYQIYFLCQKRI